MNSIPPVAFLLLAILCTLVGRLLLVRAASAISTGWALAVLFLPFAPFFFRMKHKEQAQAGSYWRLATVPLIACFFLAGGSDSFSELDDLKSWGSKTGEVAETPPAPTHGTGPETPAAAPAKRVTLVDRLLFAKKLEKLSDPRTAFTVPPAASPAEATTTTAAPAIPAAPAAPAATVPEVPIATLTPPLPVPMTLAERAAANQQEFKRLEDVYEALKRERGYLKKGDQAAVEAYNVAAAKYQAALAKARAEQTELMKLVAKK